MKIDGYHDLLEACSIERGYWDIWGREHPIATETGLRILSEMGFKVSDERDAKKAVLKLQEDRCRRALEPVQVVAGVRPFIDISLILPSLNEDTRFEWSILVETGEVHRGVFTPSGLTSAGMRRIDGAGFVHYILRVYAALPPGYHRFFLFSDEGALSLSMSLIVCPDRCYVPQGISGDGRTWGPEVQLYALRSKRNWGVGDLGDLKAAIELFGRQGAGIVGTSPLCALFHERPSHVSPYSPSSRLFLNYLYLDVEAVPDFSECDEARGMVGGLDFKSRLLSLQGRELVDYEGVAALKRQVLEVLFSHFKRNHLDANDRRAEEFQVFRRSGGKMLRLYGVFSALCEHFKKKDPGLWGWPVWPETYQDPESMDVLRFEDGHGDRIQFYQYLAWHLDRQLASAGQRSLELGLKVGLYLDLPVGVDRSGFDAWYFRGLFAFGAGIGAPPDDFNLNGQDWGLPPILPARLKAVAYIPFIIMLRRNMRYNGAVRIDHVMGLKRLFWVPAGLRPVDGAYVRYPFDDLLGILALESQRNRCMVIGEDLGTVPDEVRARLGETGVFSTRLIYFERRQDGSFKPPGEYPAQAMVSSTTHDLPTLYGFWRGRDLELRTRLGLFPSEEIRRREVAERAGIKAGLFLALRQEGLVNEIAVQEGEGVPDDMTWELAAAIYGYLARTPSKIMVLQLEDLLGQADQVNLPGTVDEYPNWKKRLPEEFESIFKDERILHLFSGLRRFFT